MIVKQGSALERVCILELYKAGSGNGFRRIYKYNKEMVEELVTNKKARKGLKIYLDDNK